MYDGWFIPYRQFLPDNQIQMFKQMYGNSRKIVSENFRYLWYF
jgi:hypothetical protein